MARELSTIHVKGKKLDEVTYYNEELEAHLIQAIFMHNRCFFYIRKHIKLVIAADVAGLEIQN